MSRFDDLVEQILLEGVSNPEFAYGERLWAYVYANANPYCRIAKAELLRFISTKWKYYSRLDELDDYALTVIFWERVDLDADASGFLKSVGVDLGKRATYRELAAINEWLEVEDSAFFWVDYRFKPAGMFGPMHHSRCILKLQMNEHANSLKDVFYHELSHFFQKALDIHRPEVDSFKSARIEALDVPVLRRSSLMYHDFSTGNFESIIRRKHDLILGLKRAYFASGMDVDEFCLKLREAIAKTFEETLDCKREDEFVNVFNANCQFKFLKVHILDLIALYSIEELWNRGTGSGKTLKEADPPSFEYWMQKELVHGESPEFSFEELLEDFRNEVE